jgi:hypothetical protein
MRPLRKSRGWLGVTPQDPAGWSTTRRRCVLPGGCTPARQQFLLLTQSVCISPFACAADGSTRSWLASTTAALLRCDAHCLAHELGALSAASDAYQSSRSL